MKVIILAAGKGSRMGDLTQNTPKCMVNFLNKPLLSYNIDIFRKDKRIHDIIVLRGYYGEKISYTEVIYYDVLNSNNMVETLFYAESELNDELIILYGDVIVDNDTLNYFIESAKDDIVVLADRNWHELHMLRVDNEFDDLESFITDEQKNITNIGDKNPTIKKVMGQYIGAIKLSKIGCEQFREFYKKMKTEINPDYKWMRGRNIRNIYMTDFLQGLIENNYPVKAVMCDRGWLEFDSERDLNCYEKLYYSGKLNNFIKLKT